MLSIPEPCNEDFTKMTPTERGAFCSKCKIDTFDFRDLSDSEINKVLLENKGEHLCGQFTNKQLDSLNRGYLNWRYQKAKTFRSKFVLALILVFGLSLFSCNTEEEKMIVELQTLEMTREPETKVKYVNYALDTPTFDLTDYVEEEVVEEEIPEVCVVPGIVEVHGDEDVTEVRTEIYQTAGVAVMLGGAVYSLSYNEYLVETVDTVEESILPEVIEIDPDFFEAKAYPNPTMNDATLALDVHVEGQFDILLFDMTGSLVQNVYSGILEEGRQNFPIELAQQQSGMYIIKVVSQDQNETIKVQKLN